MKHALRGKAEEVIDLHAAINLSGNKVITKKQILLISKGAVLNNIDFVILPPTTLQNISFYRENYNNIKRRLKPYEMLLSSLLFIILYYN